MRRSLAAILLTFVVTLSVSAQTTEVSKSENNRFPFSIKAYPFRGTFLDKGVHFEKFNGAYPAGVNLGFELPSQRQFPWQQYLGDATVGFGVSWIDMGHDMIGHSVAVYPYIMFDAIDSDYFQMRFKVAGGLAAVTEHWFTQEDQDPDHYLEPTVNTLFSSYVNAYLNAGVNLNVPITSYLALGAEFGYFHMSNGRTSMPNLGVNVLYGSVGVSATFNSQVKKTPKVFPDQPYGWAINFTGSGGVHKATMADKGRFPTSSFHAGAVYHVNNWYAIGAGADVFYNGAVTKRTNHDLYCDGEYEIEGQLVDCTTCGDEKDIDHPFKNKVRVGLAMNNEFKFGLVTAILDWGVYVYNQSRNLYNDYHMDHYGEVAPKRPLFYESAHGAKREEAFHYFRLGARCRIVDNLYVQAALKAHLNVAEFIEFGVGYQIPFLKKQNRSTDKGGVFHHHKDWWKE